MTTPRGSYPTPPRAVLRERLHGHPALKVSTGIKVANLNADRLDGIDSSYFLPTTGKAADSDKLGGQLPSYYLPASGVRRVGPITVAGTTPDRRHAHHHRAALL